MKRWKGMTGVAGALVLLLFGSGCSTEVTGEALPSVCAEHRVSACLDYEPNPPGDKYVMQVWMEDRRTAGNMLCSAFSEKELSRIMGEGNEYYRYISNDGSRACNIVTQQSGPQNDQKFSVTLSMWAQPMRGYGRVDGNERTDVSGHPAWVRDFDRGTSRSVRYTIATGTSPDTGGVLFVRLETANPRGVQTDSQPDYTHMENMHSSIAETCVSAILE
ncbi:hypothetical protein [Actinopolyspora mortivallis]|uniref:DUF3558 domain-containing protein n=1 Tax=Actinopolyspora mortivallis TaxID=33906 RepID=A0A2T0GWH5_ACTMO|nr:hypothetical protein [Actinopolyspora mortivallis]PRW63459.1 hypothetical protein CEP50_10275 [Actinopolyspora mortivallis]